MAKKLFEFEIPLLGVEGEDAAFAVQRIFCVGRNYAAHVREMGKDPQREPPFYFMKPASALVPVGSSCATVTYPPQTRNYQHEIELVVAIGAHAREVTARG